VRRASASPKLLAVDLDGTLLDPKTGAPHEPDLAALRALVASGVTVTIVTGRLYSGTRAAIDAIGIEGPVACVDGCHVVRARDHATLVHHGIRGAHADHLRDTLAKSGAATFVFARDAIVHDDAGQEFLAYVSTWSTDVRSTPSAVDHEFWRDENGVTAVVAVGDSMQIGDAAEAIHERAGAMHAVVFPIRRLIGKWGMIVRATGGSKGSALRWLAEHHGVDLSETVCVGDWMNDVPMLEVAGRAFAMGHAPDEVKRAATDVLEETAEQGGGIARIVRDVFGHVA
jgi:Cof subfamily protein (haloacid dehalogenase superfamily)